MANTGNTQQQIDYGASANDGTGDPLRTAFIKTDENFDNIWLAGPVGSNITIVNNTVQVNSTNGNLVLSPNGVGVVQTNSKLLPRLNNTYDLGSTTLKYRTGYFGAGGLSVDGNVTVTGNLTAGNISYTGNVFVGDLQGSVYADDSTIMVDAVDNELFASRATISGNVSATYFIGNGSFLTGITSSYGNANVVANLATLGSNPVSTTGNVTANYFLGNGSQLTNLPIQPGTYNNSNVVSLLSTFGSNIILTTGNISGNYFIGNGSQLTGIITNTGNVTFSGEAVIGTGTSNTQSGLYLAPDPVSLTNDLYLRVRGNIQDEPTHIHFDTGNNQYYNLIIGDDNKYIQLANTGNIVINTNNYAGNSAQWTFDYNGVLTVPASNVVPGQISTQTTDQNEKGFDLLITAGNTNGCTRPGGDLYLSAGVGYNGVSHGAGNVNIVTGDRYGNLDGNIWQFNQNGNLTLPGATAGETIATQSGYITVGNLLIGQGGSIFSKYNDSLALYGNLSDAGTSIFIPSNASAGNGTPLYLENQISNVEIRSGFGTWNFDATGNLTAPGNVSATGNITGGNISTGQGLVQSLDITADGIINAGALNVNSSAVPGATGNITGGNVLTGNISTTGNITGNTAGFAIGYRDIPQVSFTGNATIATTDAGKHYYSTLSTGNVLTIANNASQGFQIGAAITVVNQGTGTITIAQGSGVTLYLAGNATSGNRSVSTFGMATIMKVATNTWFINGTGVS